MTAETLKRTIVDALMKVAPEIDPASLDAGANFRDQLDLDSMDFLNFVLALHERLGIDIPEGDYSRLSSLDSAVAYLAARGAAKDR